MASVTTAPAPVPIPDAVPRPPAPMTAYDLKFRLRTSLFKLGTKTAFACGEYHAALPNPGLTVHDYGDVGLPISSRDADALIARCKKSAFGKGEQTIVDDTVRRSWELDHDQLTLRNPRWPSAVRGLIPAIHSKLGLICPVQHVRAELYKLLLYEEGAFFKPHQDSEKIPGMFGTLVIALPSSHQGGQLQLRHCGETFDFSTAETADFDFSWSAWYADVFHEVKPVTKGIRVVLTYNLAIDTSHATVSSAPPSEGLHHHMLKKTLGEWTARLDHADSLPICLISKLSHQYTIESLSFDSLKGDDRGYVQALKVACESTGSSLLLGTAELVVEKDDEDSDAGEISRTQTVGSLVTLAGTNFPDVQLSLTHENSLVDINFDEDEPDDEECSGYTGNEGVTSTYWYRQAVYVVVPEAGVDSFMFQGTKSWKWATSRLLELTTVSPEAALNRQQFSRLSRHILTQPSDRYSLYRWGHSATHGGGAYSTVDDRKACLEGIAHGAMLHDLLPIYDDVIKLGIAPPKLCFALMGRLIAQHHVEDIHSRLVAALKLISSTEERFAMLDQALSGFDSVSGGDKQARDALEVQCCNIVLATEGELSKEDGAAVACMIAKLSADADNSRMALVQRLLTKSVPAQIAFCLRWAARTDTFQCTDTDHRHLLVHALDHIWSHFGSTSLNSRRISQNGSHSVGTSNSPGLIQGSDISQLLAVTDNVQQSSAAQSLAELKLGTSVEQVCAKLVDVSARVETCDLHSVWVPFITMIATKKVPFLLNSDQDYSETATVIAQNILQIYITDYLGMQPSRPTHWTKPRVGTCHCKECDAVNQFLASPTETSKEYPLVMARRKHLDLQFECYGNSKTGTSDYRYVTTSVPTGDYTVDTIKTSTPHRWRITKNHKSYEKELAAWRQRLAAVRSVLKGLGESANLISLFGAEMADAIAQEKWEALHTSMHLERRRAIEASRPTQQVTPARQPLMPSSSLLNSKRLAPGGGFGPERSGKRLASGEHGESSAAGEVIDLTED